MMLANVQVVRPARAGCRLMKPVESLKSQIRLIAGRIFATRPAGNRSVFSESANPRISESANLRDATERRVDVRVVGTEPVAEAAADEVEGGGGGGALQDEVLAVEKFGGLDGIARHGLKAGEAVKDRRGPLPAVADQIVDAPGARAGGIGADGNGIPVRKAEVAPCRIGRRVAPRLRPLDAFRSAVRRAV